MEVRKLVLGEEMSEYIRQYHDEQDPQRINIHLDLTSICQYKCSYCYSRNTDYTGRRWFQWYPMHRLEKVISAIERSSLPFNLGLLGGEPTVHPQFHQILYLIDRKLNKRINGEQNYFYVVSNGARSIEWFDGIHEYENLGFLWSHHPEYTHNDSFIEKIELMMSKSFKNFGIWKSKVSLMLHISSKYWANTEDMWNKCKKIDRLKVHPQFLYRNDIGDLYPYSDKFWEWSKFFSREYEKRMVFEKIVDNRVVKDVFSEHDVIKNELNSWKGWKCMNNNYEISVEGDVDIFCHGELDAKVRGISLLDNQDFFEKIKEVKPMTCKYKRCNCDGLMKLLKFKEDYNG